MGNRGRIVKHEGAKARRRAWVDGIDWVINERSDMWWPFKRSKVKKSITLSSPLLPKLLPGINLKPKKESLTPESAFWDWFIRNNSDLNSLSNSGESVEENPIFRKLSSNLKHLHPSLTFEFSGIERRGDRGILLFRISLVYRCAR